jgi:hypothetical protein
MQPQHLPVKYAYFWRSSPALPIMWQLNLAAARCIECPTDHELFQICASIAQVCHDVSASNNLKNG